MSRSSPNPNLVLLHSKRVIRGRLQPGSVWHRLQAVEKVPTAAPSRPSAGLVAGNSQATRRGGHVTRIVMILLGVLLFGVLFWRAVVLPTTRTNDPGLSLPILGQVPEFQLTERNERTVTDADLRGRVWVADFIFTHCAGPCPLMTATMAKLQTALARQSDVRLVSISVDPERDTPETLRRYADDYKADAIRWLFLTGPIETIKALAVEGFKVGSIDDPLLHSTYFVLVDKQGAIRGYYDSAEPDLINRLAADIGLLQRERRP